MPVHRYSVFYYLGGMTLFFFIVQVVTGILLMLYYRPSAEEAFESVEFIMTTVPFGWLIRSLHSWSANLMVFFAFVHLVTVYFIKAYRKPREMTWITGCVLLFLSMAFGFSGYLLPWNQLAFFATKVGTDIAGVGAGDRRVAAALPARRRPGHRRHAVALLRLARGDPAGDHHRAPRPPPPAGADPGHERAADRREGGQASGGR